MCERAMDGWHGWHGFLLFTTPALDWVGHAFHTDFGQG